MIKLYKKISNSILKKAPFQWIIGWHKFLLIIAVLLLFSIVVSFIIPTTNYGYYTDNKLAIISVFFGFISFMTFVLYVIRQIQFNSFRIHHHIPFKKSILIFFSFWTLIFLLSYISFIPHQIHAWRVKAKINKLTNDFENDIRILNDGSVFFESNYYGSSVITHNKTKPLNKIPVDIEFRSTTRIVINHTPLNFAHYFYKYNNSNDRFPIILNKKQALNRIKEFIKIADKYNIQLIKRNPEEIFNMRKAFIDDAKEDYFTLFTIDDNITFNNNAASSYSQMMSNYSRNHDKSFDLDVFLGILVFSIILAILLWIVISVPIADFGYSVLISVILMIFMGIIVAIINIITSNDFIIRLAFFLLVFIVWFLAFFSKKQTRLYWVLKIVSHYLVALFLFLIFLEIDESSFFKHRDAFYIFSGLFLIGMVISVFVFKHVYKNYRLLPK